MSANHFAIKVGSKAQVFHGTAERTAGGLRKGDLIQTNAGRIVSKKQHNAGKVAIQRLRNAGFVAKKGEFKLFTKKSKKTPVTRTRAQHTRSFTKSVKNKKAATRASKKANKANNSKVGGFFTARPTAAGMVVGAVGRAIGMRR